MTDATGNTFLSYRRSRADEADLLIAAQHDHGIPTWQDRKDLSESPTGDELRKVLEDSFTSSALLWITPDVQTSDVMRKIEVPIIIKRYRKQDGFFLMPVCAGGTDYKQAAACVDQQLSVENLQKWNLPKVSGNPISESEAVSVAQWILRRRIEAIEKQLDPDSALRISLHTRIRPESQSGTALILDWSDRFDGREARPGTWGGNLLPALRNVSSALQKMGESRGIIVSGPASIPAATALGVAFLAQKRQKIAWNQFTPGRPPQFWTLEEPREHSGCVGRINEQDISANDLAVFVSIAENVGPAFAQTPQSVLPKFRAIVHVAHSSRSRFDIESPAIASDVALTVVETIRKARDDFRPLGVVHLFMAVPLGLAMLIGQLLNTFGPVQTYEHVPTDAVGIYKPAALLHPSI